MVPPAPGIFSTTTGWPSARAIRSLTTRATVSVGPPALNGTTTVMGRDGKSSAEADDEATTIAAKAKAVKNLRMVLYLSCSAKAEHPVHTTLSLSTGSSAFADDDNTLPALSADDGSITKNSADRYRHRS